MKINFTKISNSTAPKDSIAVMLFTEEQVKKSTLKSVKFARDNFEFSGKNSQINLVADGDKITVVVGVGAEKKIDDLVLQKLGAKIIAFLTGTNTGCTFLDWSVLYLSGQTEFYSFLDQDYIPLTHNPVTPLNAHGHKKNHLCGFDRNSEEVKTFLNHCQGLLTLYPWTLRFSQAAEQNGIDIESSILTQDLIDKIEDSMAQD